MRDTRTQHRSTYPSSSQQWQKAMAQVQHLTYSKLCALNLYGITNNGEGSCLQSPKHDVSSAVPISMSRVGAIRTLELFITA